MPQEEHMGKPISFSNPLKNINIYIDDKINSKHIHFSTAELHKFKPILLAKHGATDMASTNGATTVSGNEVVQGYTATSAKGVIPVRIADVDQRASSSAQSCNRQASKSAPIAEKSNYPPPIAEDLARRDDAAAMIDLPTAVPAGADTCSANDTPSSREDEEIQALKQITDPLQRALADDRLGLGLDDDADFDKHLANYFRKHKIDLRAEPRGRERDQEEAETSAIQCRLAEQQQLGWREGHPRR